MVFCRDLPAAGSGYIHTCQHGRTRSLKVAVSAIFVVGSILPALFLYLIALISVPVIVFFPAYFDLLLCGALPGVERGALPARGRTGYSPTTPFASSPGSHRLKPETVPWNSAYAPGV
jgi:hypothetical protein